MAISVRTVGQGFGTVADMHFKNAVSKTKSDFRRVIVVNRDG